jgi:hypothetical protein
VRIGRPDARQALVDDAAHRDPDAVREQRQHRHAQQAQPDLDPGPHVPPKRGDRRLQRERRGADPDQRDHEARERQHDGRQRAGILAPVEVHHAAQADLQRDHHRHHRRERRRAVVHQPYRIDAEHQQRERERAREQRRAHAFGALAAAAEKYEGGDEQDEGRKRVGDEAQGAGDVLRLRHAVPQYRGYEASERKQRERSHHRSGEPARLRLRDRHQPQAWPARREDHRGDYPGQPEDKQQQRGRDHQLVHVRRPGETPRKHRSSRQ